MNRVACFVLVLGMSLLQPPGSMLRQSNSESDINLVVDAIRRFNIEG